nr:hypothetical protein Iba_chr12dCG9270 [Ipomoea batatas]
MPCIAGRSVDGSGDGVETAAAVTGWSSCSGTVAASEFSSAAAAEIIGRSLLHLNFTQARDQTRTTTAENCEKLLLWRRRRCTNRLSARG